MCERILKYFLLLLMAISVVGCKDDEPEPEPEVPVEEGHAVFVLNEGTFQWGNATLSHIKLTTNEVQEDVFAPANNRPIGDVLQSAAMIDGKIASILAEVDTRISKVLSAQSLLLNPRRRRNVPV